MKKVEKELFQLELSEIIRVNQLIRENINFQGFKDWYEKLSIPEQSSLIGSLVEFSWQAGIDATILCEAKAKTTNEEKNLTIEKASSFLEKPHFFNSVGFINWLNQIVETERFVIFTFSVYLFGLAEGKVYKNEQKEWCNHWWHRNLLNENVVNDILNNPKYYLTSMKDDEKIEGNIKWNWKFWK